MVCLNLIPSLPVGKHRWLTCARYAHQCNSFRELIFSQLLHCKEGLFSAAYIARLKNSSSLRKQTCGLYTVSHFIPKRRNATVFENWYSLNCCIVRRVYFQPLTSRGWKTRQVCENKLADYIPFLISFRNGVMQQFSRIDILSTVAL